MKNLVLVLTAFAALAAVGTVIALSLTNQQARTQSAQEIQLVAPEPFNITTSQASDSATILVSLNLAQENTTTVIPPNGTIIEVDGNITAVDNDTVIILPDNETVTEVPGNVTVITPPEPEPCGCPVINETVPEPSPIPPVQVTPAPGQNISATFGNETEVITQPPAAPVNETADVIIESNETEITVPPEGNLTAEQLPVFPEGNESASVEPASLEAMYESFINRLQA